MILQMQHKKNDGEFLPSGFNVVSQAFEIAIMRQVDAEGPSEAILRLKVLSRLC